MSGLHEVDCSGCGRRHLTNADHARKQRVLRCECGYFVRLDRTPVDRRSEPTPPPVEITSVRAGLEEEDATHLMNSATAAVVLGGRSPRPSLADDERSSRPAAPNGASHSRPSSPAQGRPRQASLAPTDKPLWYVDLGGPDLVEMTIEQLILARRGGKLGEGALVWREGMPTWRPVGTLISATSASSHPAPQASPIITPVPSRPSTNAAARTPFPTQPPAAKRPPPTNPPPEEATPRSLGSYERPMATLEFALEKHEATPLIPATRSPLPSLDSGAGRLSRPATPLPRASLSSVLSTPFPRPANLPRVAPVATSAPTAPARVSSPPPPAEPVAAPVAASATAARSSDRPHQHALLNLQIADTLSERPRWVSACIALVVCVTASAAGASLVRSLKQRPKAQAAAAVSATAPVVHISAVKPAVEEAQSAPSSAPHVVDVESLSVERKRAVPRTVRAMPRPAPAPTQPVEADDEATPSAKDTAPSAPESTTSEASNSSDLPAAARSNPYGSGSLIDQIKKATADEEAGQ